MISVIEVFEAFWEEKARLQGAGDQPRLIQGIRRGDDFGEFTGYTGFN